MSGFQLLVRIQNKEQSLAELAAENSNLTSAFNAAEGRLTELYAEQARMEEETAARIDLVDRLRAQVQELERENRDVIRRYNEQVCTTVFVIVNLPSCVLDCHF